jgi:pimeloyl-ACP methyl ester carboxylesterase
VIYCHGWPSSRLEAGLVANLPLRLIAVDRPGYGLSDPRLGLATLEGLAFDVAALADHLQLGRFAVAGVSGGGPLACACAYYLVGRISALTLISAVPPPEAVRGGALGLLMWLGRRPWLCHPAIRLARQCVLSKRWAEAVMFGDVPPGRDAETLTPAIRAGLLEAMREGLRPNSSGALADAGHYGRSWGFRLQDIGVPASVWHGTADHLVAASAALAYSAIPGSSVHVLDGEGHYSLALGQTHMIMNDLVARAAASANSTGMATDPS